MKKNKKTIWTAVLVVSVVLVICALGVLCWYLFGLYNSGNEYNSDNLPSGVISDTSYDTYDLPTVSSSVISEISDENTSKKETESKKSDSSKRSSDIDTDIVNEDINFTELWKINPDIYAWIRVPNTPIDYPVLQYNGGDDSFYLSHNMYKQYAFAGSIYTESLNSKDFSDPNTVLYGHNMLNGTMFRGLHNFRNPDFFEQNQHIIVYLPDRTLVYQVFSAYEYDDRHILYSFDFNDDDVFAEYLEYAQNPTSSMTYNTRNLGVTTEDKIITLSTCMDDIDTSRYLVQGVLVSDEPTEE